MRQCRDEADLEELYRSIRRQFGEEWDASDRRLDEARSRFGRDRDLMFALVDGTRIRGGVEVVPGLVEVRWRSPA